MGASNEERFNAQPESPRNVYMIMTLRCSLFREGSNHSNETARGSDMSLVNTNTVRYDTSGRRRKKRKAKGEVYRKYTPPPFQELTRDPMPYRRGADVVYKSADDNSGIASRAEPKRYTGSLVKGIATMHKSNAVPIIDDQQAKDISAMRRG